MKKWGYYFLENGTTKRISASQVIYKDDTEGGWRDINYYPRKNGTGGVIHAKISTTGKKFFAFNNTQDKDEWERTGGGESQTHYLFKMALLELGETTLSFKGKKMPNTRIKLSNAVDEYGAGPYFIDVFCEFESDNELDIKWERKLGIEVCLTNPVEKPKKDYLIEQGIPVVQHKISDKMLYSGPEDQENPIEERKYIDYIKSKLSKHNGFIEVSLISNPSSETFELMVKNSQLIKQNNELKQEIESLKEDLIYSNEKETALSQQLSVKEDEIFVIEKKLNETSSNNDDLEKTFKLYNQNEWIYLLVIFTILGVGTVGLVKGFIEFNL